MTDTDAFPMERACRESLLGPDSIPPLQDIPLHRVSRLLYLQPGVYESHKKAELPWMAFHGLFLPQVQEVSRETLFSSDPMES